MRPSKLLVEQLIHLYHSPWIHPLYESQNNKPDLLFADGNIRIVLLFVDSTLAITSWHTITSYYSTRTTRTSLFLVYKE
jgi:hypothetical protein